MATHFGIKIGTTTVLINATYFSHIVMYKQLTESYNCRHWSKINENILLVFIDFQFKYHYRAQI